MDDGCGHPINLLNENQEESHHFKTKTKKKLYVNKLQSSNSQSSIYKLNPRDDKT